MTGRGKPSRTPVQIRLNMKSIEELREKEKQLSFFLNVLVTLLILLGIFLIGWVVSVVVYADESMLLPGTGTLSRCLALVPAPPTVPAPVLPG